MRRLPLLATLALAPSPAHAQQADTAGAQHYQSDFPPEEFKARWAAVLDRIGNEAVAVVQGVPLTNGFQLPRQSNSLYYLSGIETPHAYLRLDGRDRRVTLYLPPRNERLERSEGKVLSAADAELVKRLTGADAVLSTEAMGASWPLADGKPAAIYTESVPAEGYAQSRYELQAADASIANDFWDGRGSRESRFVELLRTRQPRARIQDLTPILDEIRGVKSPREIALVRRASELAGLGVMEAIRSTETGVFEYQLDAACRYVFLLNDARLDGYRSITASGTANIWNAHYFRNSEEARGRRPGSDGLRARLPLLRERHRAHVAGRRQLPSLAARAAAVRARVQERRAVRVSGPACRPTRSAPRLVWRWTPCSPARASRSRPSRRRPASWSRRAAASSRTPSGWPFTMSAATARLLKPGHVFSVDPQLWVPEENLYIRYEDTVVVTETGVENFTAFLPSELADLEALAREKGIVQTLPAVTEAGFERLRSHPAERRARLRGTRSLSPDPGALGDPLETAHVGTQRLRHDDRAVLLLVVLEDGDERAAHRQPAPLSVCTKRGLPLRLGRDSGCSRAGPGSPCSSSRTRSRGRPAGRAARPRCRRSCAAEKPMSPVAQHHHAVGQPEALQHLLGVRASCSRARRIDVSGVVNFTSSTLWNWCCRISPRTSLPYEPASRGSRACRRTYFSGSSARLEDLVAVEVGERDLGGRDQVEVAVAGRGLEEVLLELRQLAGPGERSRR